LEIVTTAVASGTADVQAIAAFPGGQWMMGFSVTEDAIVPALSRVRLHHGTSSAGPELFDVHLLASGSAREWFGQYGPDVRSGVFIDRVLGTTRLTVYTRLT